MSTTEPERDTTHRGVEAIARRLGVSSQTLRSWPRTRWEFAVIRQDESGRWIMDEREYLSALSKNTESMK